MNDENSHIESESEYSRILDHVAIACVDALVINEGKLLLGKRANKPNQSWWIFGGRMWPGEAFKDTARRGAKRETGLEIDKSRFEKLDVYNLIWPERNEHPQTKKCHHVLVAMYVEISNDEAERIVLQNDHTEYLWLDLSDVKTFMNKFCPELNLIITDICKKLHYSVT